MVGDTGTNSSEFRVAEDLTILVCRRCHNKVPQTGHLKQWTFISHSPGGWTSKVKAPADGASIEGSLPGSCCILTCGRGEGALWDRYSKGTNSIHGGSTPVTSSPPQNPISQYHLLGVGFQYTNFRGRQTFRP